MNHLNTSPRYHNLEEIGGWRPTGRLPQEAFSYVTRRRKAEEQTKIFAKQNDLETHTKLNERAFDSNRFSLSINAFIKPTDIKYVQYGYVISALPLVTRSVFIVKYNGKV